MFRDGCGLLTGVVVVGYRHPEELDEMDEDDAAPGLPQDLEPGAVGNGGRR